jgi:hypothetical protein
MYAMERPAKSCAPAFIVPFVVNASCCLATKLFTCPAYERMVVVVSRVDSRKILGSFLLLRLYAVIEVREITGNSVIYASSRSIGVNGLLSVHLDRQV